jgi:integrase
MTSINVKFRPSTANHKEGTVYYQIIHRRIIRQVKTGYKILPDEWNSDLSMVHIPPSSDDGRKEYLCSIIESINKDKKRMEQIVTDLKNKMHKYAIHDIVSAFHSCPDVNGLLAFMQNVIDLLRKTGKVRTVETYTCALNSFMRFRKGEDVSLNEIDSELMQIYQAWLLRKGLCMNTVSFYMQILRAVYNRAVDKQLVLQHYPFKHVYTGIEKTVKRAVPLNVIKQLKQLNLAAFPPLDYARYMFLFGFYTRGMSFIDIAYLKKKDLNGDTLSYRRQKTGQLLVIKWESCMQQVLDQYPSDPDSVYLLPIIKKGKGDERPQYKNAIMSINKSLGKLSEMLGLSISLTTYVARHSWASIAKSKNIPLSVISEGMGHDSEATTYIYLASLDTSVVDNANRLILKEL